MASVTGPVYVPAPNPIVQRYGLFRAATGPIDLPQHARIGGLQYEISTCKLPLGYTINCQESHASKTIDTGLTTVVGNPFIVYSAIRCDTVGLVNWGRERVEKYLYEQLIAGEQATVEAIFSAETFGQSPGLPNGGAAVNLGTAQGPVQGIAKLENWLYARYGIEGVIHAPIYAAAYFAGAHTLYIEGDISTAVCKTDLGTKVSFGNYANTGPTGQAAGAGNVWVYITGQVAVFRTPDSELFVPDMGQVINRSTNVLTIVMEREYVITYDCFVAAVEVTLNTTDR